jgi:hypothetical protein
MLRNRRQSGFARYELLLVYVIIVLVLALWTDRNLGWAVSAAKGTPVDTPYWVACLASIPFPLTFLANVVAEVLRLFF